jgi:hypothetical protein
MMFPKIKSVITKKISNIPGWTTDQKMVAFLVDDWGAIRIRDKRAYLTLKKAHNDLD